MLMDGKLILRKMCEELVTAVAFRELNCSPGELFPIGPLVSYFLTARTHSFFPTFFFVAQNEIKCIASSP